jgi:hypothetical protein
MGTVHQSLFITVNEVKLPNPLVGSGHVYVVSLVLGVYVAKLVKAVILTSPKVIKVLVVVKHDDVKT